MRAFRAVVFGRGIDAVALFQLVLAHALHVVFYDLRRIGHALGPDGRSLHREREANGGCQRRCNKQTTGPDVFPLLVRPEAGTRRPSFAPEAQKATPPKQTFSAPAKPSLITGGDPPLP